VKTEGPAKPEPARSAEERRKAPRAPKSTDAEKRLTGIAVSPGIAIGLVYDTSEATPETPRRTITEAEAEAERTKLSEAAALSRKQVGKLKARLGVLPEEAQEELEPLLDAYILMLGNSRLLRGARKRIGEELLAAETAVHEEAEAIAAAILANKDDDKSGLNRRAGEVREIARRLIRNLTATPFRSLKGVPQGAILVAEELTPADAALLEPGRISAVCTEEGGADGHTAIMLRALGIPAVLGCHGLTAAAKRGDHAVVDGAAGFIALHPSAETLATAKEGIAAQAKERARLGKLRRLPAETTDGQFVELQANLEIPAELPLLDQAGAQGVGLLRTEFLFMNRSGLPDEDDQVSAYRMIARRRSRRWRTRCLPPSAPTPRWACAAFACCSRTPICWRRSSLPSCASRAWATSACCCRW
jgi:phosphotransferase system enzyme I (PtsI)